jgi:hypothetical protein
VAPENPKATPSGGQPYNGSLEEKPSNALVVLYYSAL